MGPLQGKVYTSLSNFTLNMPSRTGTRVGAKGREGYVENWRARETYFFRGYRYIRDISVIGSRCLRGLATDRQVPPQEGPVTFRHLKKKRRFCKVDGDPPKNTVSVLNTEVAESIGSDASTRLDTPV